MSGEKNLSKLLANLSPALTEEEYVFCTFIDSSYGDFLELKPVASMMEKEGLSLVLEKKKAKMAVLALLEASKLRKLLQFLFTYSS